jgi:outer membrane protein assembly factor BamB
MDARARRAASRLLRTGLVIVASLVAACGGGGGGGGGDGGTGSNAPCIFAQKIDFPATATPAGFNTGALVQVLDNSCNLVVTNASVTMNGVALLYNPTFQDYEGNIAVAPGGAVNLSVTVAGATYSVSATQFASYPTITAPAAAVTWSSLLSNLVAWSGGSPVAHAQYAIGVLDAADPNGQLLWPASNLFDLESVSTSNVAIPPSSLTPGNRLVIVGILTGFAITGAASGSGLFVGGFNYAPITVVSSVNTTPLVSITVTPSNPSVAKGATKQLTATGTHADTGTEDLTTQVTWSSTDTSKVTVSASGLVTGVDFGSATITATLGSISGSTLVSVSPPTSVTVTPQVQTILKGANFQLTAIAEFPDNSTVDITSQAVWSSSDPAKVSVNATGLVTGVDFGPATVTATSGSVFGSTSISVFQVNPSPAPPLGQSVAYQIDYAHAGAATFGTTITFPSTAAWSVALNGPVSYPLIAGGKVFVMTGAGGSPYGTTLYALDQVTGASVWGPTFIPGTYFRAGLAYDHGTLFVINFEGVLSSFDAATGQPGWSTQLPGSFYDSPPTAVNGIVYVGGSGALRAVDEANGSVIWTAGVANGDQSAPTVSSDGVFVSYPCQTYKFDPITGSPLWHNAGGCEGGGGRTSVYANGLLYVRDEISTTAQILDAATGNQVNTFPAPFPTPAPAFSATTGFFQSSGTLQAIDLGSHNALWSFAGDSNTANLVSAPVFVDHYVFVGTSSGNVYALDTSNNGSSVWSKSAGAAIQGPDEHNVSGPLTGFGLGEGYLVVPAGSVLTAWRLIGP